MPPMGPSYIEQLQQHNGLLADKFLSMPDVQVRDVSLHSHALRMKACNHLKEDFFDGGRSPAHCTSSICGTCGRWRYEQVADRARFHAQCLQSNPKALFKEVGLTVKDVSTDEIRDTAKILRKGCGQLITPVKGMLGSLFSLEVATSAVNPKLENVHVHGLIALDAGKHSGQYRYSKKKWREAWCESVENARDAHVKTLPEAADVNRFIDYSVPTNDMKKGFLARISDALKDPGRYVDRARQLWKLERHWPSGGFEMPSVPQESGSGLWTAMTKQTWETYYSKAARSLGPITEHPLEDIPIAES